MSALPNPAAPVSSPPPSVDRIFETLHAHRRTEVLKAAIELEVFSAIAEGNHTVSEIASCCRASERGIRILCDFLTTMGFLAKSGTRYDLTPDTAIFLDRKSPQYIGGIIEFLLSPMILDPLRRLADAVRTGTTVTGDGTLAPNHPVWVKFARAMAPLMSMPAQLLADLAAPGLPPHARILDIASSHGMFGIAFAKRLPNASITAVDWPEVVKVGEENARNAGVGERYRTLPGSAFEVDFGSGYDLALITNFLHHFNRETIESFLRKVYGALKQGGRTVTLEFIPNEDRVSPPVPAQFSLEMLVGTPEGDAYTFSELREMFERAGFSSSTLHELPPSFSRVVVSRK